MLVRVRSAARFDDFRVFVPRDRDRLSGFGHKVVDPLEAWIGSIVGLKLVGSSRGWYCLGFLLFFFFFFSLRVSGKVFYDCEIMI